MPASPRAAFALLALIVSAAPLAGCAKPDDEVCANEGFAPGTPEFGNCMEGRQSRRAAFFGTYMQNLQAQQAQQQAIGQQNLQSIYNQQPHNVQTNCSTYGNNTNCNSTGY